MIADVIAKSEGKVQLVINAADLKELVNQWMDERDAEKEAERKSVESDQLVSSGEAGIILGVTTATLWRWAKNGYLVPIKVGRKNVYRKSDIDRIQTPVVK